MPEPVIALMAFILGIWMWNRYFTPVLEYAPGTERLALVKIDRDLRLADATENDPAWLRKLMGARNREDVSVDALKALEKLENWQAMTRNGAVAYEIIRAVQREEPVPVTEGIEALPSWWRARENEVLEQRGRISGGWRGAYQHSLRVIRARSLMLSSALVAIVVAGALSLPHAIRSAVRSWPKSPKGYVANWSPALGLTVFMVATLAWIGYVGTLDLGLENITSFPPVMGLFLDTASRLLPVLIALGFLFKRPSHVIRALGIDSKPDVRMVLGSMTVVLLLDHLVDRAMGSPWATEPAGGLAMADAGPTGLMFVLFSACFVAPITEEILYRGVLFRSLSNHMGAFAAAFVSAVVFSSVHFYDLQGFISVAMFGFVCALLYRATGSLTTVMALHVLYNVSIKIPAWVFYHARLDS